MKISQKLLDPGGQQPFRLPTKGCGRALCAPGETREHWRGFFKDLPKGLWCVSATSHLRVTAGAGLPAQPNSGNCVQMCVGMRVRTTAGST